MSDETRLRRTMVICITVGVVALLGFPAGCSINRAVLNASLIAGGADPIAVNCGSKGDPDVCAVAIAKAGEDPIAYLCASQGRHDACTLSLARGKK